MPHSSTTAARSTQLGRLAWKTGLVALPFLIYGMVIAAVDPYNLFGLSSLVDDRYKQDISYKLNYAMWKMLQYRHDPQPAILLGDSRMMNLPADTIEQVSGQPWANLAYGGGSLREAIATFHYADSMVELERVVLGVNFNLYNAADDKDRVAEVTAALDNPLLYFSNRNVMTATTKLIPAAITRSEAAIGEPAMSKEAFWRYQLETTTRVYYGNYRYPEAYLEQLQEIAEHCLERDIALSFVIFPGHTDLQDLVGEYGLEAEYERFVSDISQLGTTYHFDYPSELTQDMSLFRDPYHLTDEAEPTVIQAVWGQARDHVRVLGPGSPG